MSRQRHDSDRQELTQHPSAEPQERRFADAEIGSDIDSDQIAEHLSVGIGQSAQVREASEADRTIVIAFE
ncbi:MAG: hypothetical protein WCQ48_08775 [Chloroflexota bacterium]